MGCFGHDVSLSGVAARFDVSAGLFFYFYEFTGEKKPRRFPLGVCGAVTFNQ